MGAIFSKGSDHQGLFGINGPGYDTRDHQSFGERLFSWHVRNLEYTRPVSDALKTFGKEVGAMAYQANPLSMVVNLIMGSEGPQTQTALGTGASYAAMLVTPGGAARGGD